MKCIYCNSEAELTSSDIITYAITGAKLTKSFVCKTHNAFTMIIMRKICSWFGFFRNHLGLTTRDGKPIQYKADISVDGTELHNVKSVIESLCMHLKMLLQELMIMETKF